MLRPAPPRSCRVGLRHCAIAVTFQFGLLAVAARAQTLEKTYTVTAAPSGVASVSALELPLFDPTLGTLMEARISLTANFAATLDAENTDTTSPFAVTLLCAPSISLTSNGAALVTAHANEYVSRYLMPFDGTIDYGGPSGMFQSVEDCAPATASFEPSSPEFAAFIASPGSNAGTFGLDIEALLECEPFGNPAIEFHARGAAAPQVSVTYAYSTTGVGYCAGDGTGGGCPCGNLGLAGHGCASPATLSGARLDATGDPSVSIDTFMLRVSDLPASTVIVLLQGDTGMSQGTPFGAGIHCVGGSVLRLATRLAARSITVGGKSSGVSISVAGAIPPAGGTRYYQVAYREGQGACNGAPVNFSNGWRVAWRP